MSAAWLGNCTSETFLTPQANRIFRICSGSAGTVESVNVMRDQATGRARGFAFVEMGSDEDATNRDQKLNNYSFGGRNLTVNEARPKERTGGGAVAMAAAVAAVAAGAEPRW